MFSSPVILYVQRSSLWNRSRSLLWHQTFRPQRYRSSLSTTKTFEESETTLARLDPYQSNLLFLKIHLTVLRDLGPTLPPRGRSPWPLTLLNVTEVRVPYWSVPGVFFFYIYTLSLVRIFPTSLSFCSRSQCVSLRLSTVHPQVSLTPPGHSGLD